MHLRRSRALLGAAVILCVFGGAGQALAKADLAKAVAKKNRVQVERLMKGGKGINEVDSATHTALYYACLNGDFELVSRLLDKGADVNVTDVAGDTPLHVLLLNAGDPGVAAGLLIAKGADVNKPNNLGRTPLMNALVQASATLDLDSQERLIRQLLSAGADPNRTDRWGSNALHFAVATPNNPVVLELIFTAMKAPRAKNINGWEPLTVAVEAGQEPAARFLMDHGQRPVLLPARRPDVSGESRLRQDPAFRINAVAFDWYGSWLAEHGSRAEALAAWKKSRAAYDAAIAEDQRLGTAFNAEAAKDKKARDTERAQVFALAVVSVGVTAGTGYTSSTYMPGYGNSVEADRQGYAFYAREAGVLDRRRADLDARIATLSAAPPVAAAPSAPAPAAH